MEGARVSSKYQVVIPKAIREALGIEPGDRIVFFRRDGVVQMVKPMTLEQFRGIARDADPTGYRDRDDRIP